MSNLVSNSNKVHCKNKPCEQVDLVITPKAKNLGDIVVRRILPSKAIRMIGPWIFFDHAGPVKFKAGKGVDVRPHPHINLATVTYLFEGELLHRDSLGTVQIIKPGDINLMVAGNGIVHSERTPDAIRENDHTIHALQLWLALPVESEETTADFHHYPAEELPFRDKDGVRLRVMIGSAFGMTSPVKTFSSTLYAEACINNKGTLLLPKIPECGIYVIRGKMVVNDLEVDEHSMVILKNPDNVVLHFNQETQIAIIGGKPLGQRFIDWNFVSSSRERIQQAKAKWKSQLFPVIEGDSNEFIPLPE